MPEQRPYTTLLTDIANCMSAEGLESISESASMQTYRLDNSGIDLSCKFSRTTIGKGNIPRHRKMQDELSIA